jgi:hypothetical protein
MTQPTIPNLLGTGAAWLAANASVTEPGLFIPASALQTTGLDISVTPSALALVGAIDQLNHNWLSTNTDAAVMMTSDLSAIAPSTRNGSPKTQFQFTKRHFRAYAAPSFDPDLDS